MDESSTADGAGGDGRRLYCSSQFSPSERRIGRKGVRPRSGRKANVSRLRLDRGCSREAHPSPPPHAFRKPRMPLRDRTRSPEEPSPGHDGPQPHRDCRRTNIRHPRCLATSRHTVRIAPSTWLPMLIARCYEWGASSRDETLETPRAQGADTNDLSPTPRNQGRERQPEAGFSRNDSL